MAETFNAADPAQVKQRQRTVKDAEKQRQEDLLTLLALPEFRRYVWRVMNETCGLMRSAASPNGSTQSINIGMQDVARAMWAEIESVAPLSIPTMMREHFEAQK